MANKDIKLLLKEKEAEIKQQQQSLVDVPARVKIHYDVKKIRLFVLCLCFLHCEASSTKGQYIERGGRMTNTPSMGQVAQGGGEEGRIPIGLGKEEKGFEHEKSDCLKNCGVEIGKIGVLCQHAQEKLATCPANTEKGVMEGLEGSFECGGGQGKTSLGEKNAKPSLEAVFPRRGIPTPFGKTFFSLRQPDPTQQHFGGYPSKAGYMASN